MGEAELYKGIVEKMKEERLNEIKNSIDLQITATKAYEYDETLLNEEVELYDEVVRLREENEMLKDAQKNFEKQFIKEMDYKTRCEKAIEYIKKHIEKCNIDGYEGKFDNFDIFTKPQKILNILNGKEWWINEKTSKSSKNRTWW